MPDVKPPIEKPRDVLLFPKQSLLAGARPIMPRIRYSLPMFVAAILFLTSVTTVGGVYAYRLWFEKKVEILRQDLDRKEAEIDMDGIAHFARISDHLNRVVGVLEGHVALSALFDILQKSTSIYVSYVDFSYLDDGDTPVVTLIGYSPSYASLYMQSEALEKLPEVIAVKVENPTLEQKTGQVKFSMRLTLDAGSMRYERHLASIAAGEIPNDELTAPPPFVSTGTSTNP